MLHEEVVNAGSGSKQLIHVGDRHYGWGCEHNKLHLQIQVEVILDLSTEFFEADKGVSQIVDEPVSILQLDYQLNYIWHYIFIDEIYSINILSTPTFL